jgi:hypothetical protein
LATVTAHKLEEANVAQRTDSDWDALARDLAQRVSAFAPDWTDFNDSDPGVTIAELFAFLAESLLAGPGQSPRATARLRDVLTRLERLDRAPCPERTPTRVRYFTGQLLSAADLQQEQDYHRSRQRRHNLMLHGVGIVSGLDVGIQPASRGQGPRVEVSPGVAIGPDGEELLVCEPLTGDVCQGGSPCYVTVRLGEKTTAPTSGGEASRIEEAAELAIVEAVPPTNLAIARIRRDGKAWRLDPGFQPARLGR